MNRMDEDMGYWYDRQGEIMAIASLAVGVVSIIFVLSPLIGFTLSIISIVLGSKARRYLRSPLSSIGFYCGVVASFMNLIYIFIYLALMAAYADHIMGVMDILRGLLIS